VFAALPDEVRTGITKAMRYQMIQATVARTMA
jgi:hypothetical protein